MSSVLLLLLTGSIAGALGLFSNVLVGVVEAGEEWAPAVGVNVGESVLFVLDLNPRNPFMLEINYMRRKKKI